MISMLYEEMDITEIPDWYKISTNHPFDKKEGSKLSGPMRKLRISLVNRLGYQQPNQING